MKKNLIFFIVAVVLVGIAIWDNLTHTAAPAETAAKVGYLAPSFAMEGMDGNTYTFDAAHLERPVIINVWASWCEPCRLEAPDLAAIYEQYKGKVDIYAVNMTQSELQGTEKVKQFVQEYDLQMPILYDKESIMEYDYHIISIPTSFVVDRNGYIRDIIYGPINKVSLEKRLNSLL